MLKHTGVDWLDTDVVGVVEDIVVVTVLIVTDNVDEVEDVVLDTVLGTLVEVVSKIKIRKVMWKKLNIDN